MPINFMNNSYKLYRNKQFKVKFLNIFDLKILKYNKH